MKRTAFAFCEMKALLSMQFARADFAVPSIILDEGTLCCPPCDGMVVANLKKTAFATTVRSNNVLDVLFIVITVSFFLASWAYVRGCDRF
jgi:hypothetical protein